MNFTQGGGSSSVLSSALKASFVKLVDLVDDEDLERQVVRLALVADLLRVLDGTVGSGVDLDDVEAVALLDRETDRIVQGEIRLRAAGAVQGLPPGCAAVVVLPVPRGPTKR
jgi:hypothetical protein